MRRCQVSLGETRTHVMPLGGSNACSARAPMGTAEGIDGPLGAGGGGSGGPCRGPGAAPGGRMFGLPGGMSCAARGFGY
ncbi:hypothetical protein GCM10023195_20080 [Actinoallomurus liliacearum]|uniref:Uncharacterized protein n=1 Tax=Actinoallomurus liliacearum TaxID=1080073 RepID=A0ABP8TH79_9ACTN